MLCDRRGWSLDNTAILALTFHVTYRHCSSKDSVLSIVFGRADTLNYWLINKQFNICILYFGGLWDYLVRLQHNLSKPSAITLLQLSFICWEETGTFSAVFYTFITMHRNLTLLNECICAMHERVNTKILPNCPILMYTQFINPCPWAEGTVLWVCYHKHAQLSHNLNELQLSN